MDPATTSKTAELSLTLGAVSLVIRVPEAALVAPGGVVADTPEARLVQHITNALVSWIGGGGGAAAPAEASGAKPSAAPRR